MRKLAVILACLVGACGGDGSGPSSGDGTGALPNEHVPQISNLTLSPNTAEYMESDGEVLVSAELSFQDSGADLQTLWVETPDGSRIEFGEAGNEVAGTLNEQFKVSTATVGSFAVDVWVIDRAGNRSNLSTAMFNVVGDTQADTWTKRLGDLPFVLNDVTWLGEAFVAVGDAGKILMSSDGIHWVERQSGTDVDLIAVTSRGSDVVAVGHDATVLLSTDAGVSWSVKHNGDRVRLAAVAINASQFVTGGMDLDTGDTIIMRSVDRGESWAVAGSVPQSGHFVTDLVYANDIFVAGTDAFSSTSDARVMVSGDGDVWNEIILRDEIAASYAILYDGSEFIAAGSSNTVFVSPDGYNWRELQTPVEDVDYRSAAWNGSQLVVAGGITWWYWWMGTPAFERPVGLSSTDTGVTWDIFNIDGYYESNGMAWGNGRFVSVGESTPISGEGAIYTSD